jgi:hypothetical protein
MNDSSTSRKKRRGSALMNSKVSFSLSYTRSFTAFQEDTMSEPGSNSTTGVTPNLIFKFFQLPIRVDFFDLVGPKDVRIVSHEDPAISALR